MWLEKLVELWKKSGKTTKQIADEIHISEKTIGRIFTGETDRPYMDTLHDIVTALGGSLDDIFAEGKARLANEDLITSQNEAALLASEVALLKAENSVLKDKVAALTAEVDLLHLNLDHKEEIIALHTRYNAIFEALKK